MTITVFFRTQMLTEYSADTFPLPLPNSSIFRFMQAVQQGFQNKCIYLLQMEGLIGIGDQWGFPFFIVP